MAIVPNENYVAFYDPKNPVHREWLLAVLDHVTALDPMALSEGPLRDLWTAPGTSPEKEEVTLAMPLIREFEGLRLKAYPDPHTGGEPWTIGWGLTRYPDGSPVRKGDTITAEQAAEYLQMRVIDDLHVQEARVPNWGRMTPPQRAALLSFGHNLGARWYGSDGFSRLTAAIKGEAWATVPKILELYRNPGSSVEPGLLRRRQAEGRLFASGSPKPPAVPPGSNPLPVRPFLQLDSETDQARRMCFSSACAMLLEYLKPGTLKGVNGDDQYLRTVQRFGDTTDAAAQVRALQSYGIKARFVQNADFKLIEAQIKAGIPVPCGYLHRGPVDRPSGGGHWLTVIGHDPSRVAVHDPLGEPDLINGTTLNSRGANLLFSRQNFGKRWMVEQVGGAYRYAPGKGWAIVAERPA
jgi:GH24 family phage-related lysozyme (muramidase)